MRVVSLLASATEMVAALGALDDLVGRSHECDWPPAVLALPAVSRPAILVATTSAAIDAQVKARARAAQTAAPDALAALSIFQIDPEALRTLAPDVILTQTQCEVCAVSERDVQAALRQIAGLNPRIVSLAPYRLADVWRDVARVGAALGREDAAHRLLADIADRLERLRSAAPPVRPRVALLEWLDPLMGAGNWIPELIAVAGGAPCFGDAGAHSPWLTWDDLAAADPDAIILAPCGYTIARTLADVPLLTANPAWGALRAVRAGRVFVADGNAYFNRSGPRLVDSAEALAAMLHDGAAHQDHWQRLS